LIIVEAVAIFGNPVSMDRNSRLTRLTEIFTDVSADIFALSQRIYKSSFLPSFVSADSTPSGPGQPGPSSAGSTFAARAPIGAGSTTVIHDHSVNYYSPSPFWPIWAAPAQPTVIVTCPHATTHACEDCKKNKKDTKDSSANYYFGAFLIGALAVGFSYVFTSEYINYWQLRQINAKIRKLDRKITESDQADAASTVPVPASLYPPSAGSSVAPMLRTLPRTWDQWYWSYQRSARLFTVCKLGFLLSGALLGTGLMRNSSDLLQYSFWSFVGTSAATASVATLYNLLWKADETKNMNQLVQDCNTIHLTMSSPTAPPL
jgi:hypothetical protein